MSQKEYQKDLLLLIGKTEASISDLAKATGHSRDYMREKLYGLPFNGSNTRKTYAVCDAAGRLYPKREKTRTTRARG